MSAKYFIDQAGNYIGAYDGAEPPADAVEVAAPPPDHASQQWTGAAWIDSAATAAWRADQAAQDNALTQAELTALLLTKGQISQADIDARKAARK